MDLNNAKDMVGEFHEHIGERVSEKPSPLPCNTVAARWLATQIRKLGQTASEGAGGDVLLGRAALALEELAEWVQAHADQDLDAVADAWADRAYVLMGDAVAAGLPTRELFETVHRSNMTKMAGVRTGVGKAFRGPGYEAPEVHTVMQATQAE